MLVIRKHSKAILTIRNTHTYQTGFWMPLLKLGAGVDTIDMNLYNRIGLRWIAISKVQKNNQLSLSL